MNADFFDRLEGQLRSAVPAHAARQRAARARRLGLLTAAAGAAAAAVILVLALGGMPGSSGLRPAPASAAQLLERAASAAARQPPEPPLQRGQYHYSRELDSQLVPFGDHRQARVTVAVERWVAADGDARVRTEAVGAPIFFTAADRRAWQRAGEPPLGRRQARLVRQQLSAGRPGHPFHVGPRLLSFAELRALPTAPSRLSAVLARYAREYHVPRASTASYEFSFATQIIRGTPASPALRAAAFRVLASLPGVRAEGTLRDRAGRPGAAVSIAWADMRRVLIFDPGAARLLEERFLTLPRTRNVKPSYPRLPAGTLIGFIAQQAVGVVDSATGRVP